MADTVTALTANGSGQKHPAGGLVYISVNSSLISIFGNVAAPANS